MYLIPFLLGASVHAVKLSDRDVRQQQKSFLNGKSPDGLSLFDDASAWGKLHTTAFFSGMDGRTMQRWVKWLGQQGKDRRAKFIQGTTPEDLASLSAHGGKKDYGSACYNLAGLVDAIPRGQIEGLKEGCLEEVLRGVVFEQPAWLSQLPKSVIQEQAAQIIVNLGKRVTELKPETLSLLLGGKDDENACSHLSAKYLPLFSEVQAKKITSKCFAAIEEGWEEVSGLTAKQLARFNSDLFEWSQQTNLPESLFTALRKEQLSRWGARLDTEDQCRNLRPEEIKPTVLAGLTSNCMSGFIRGLLNEEGSSQKTSKKSSKKSYKKRAKKSHVGRQGSLALGANRWAALKADIFSGLEEEDLLAGLALIPEEEWKRMPMALVEGLLGLKGGCRALPAAASQVAWNKMQKPLIDARCFVELSTDIQPVLLQQLPSLPDDLLRFVGKSHVRRWELAGKEGLNCLGVLKSRSNRAALLAALSSDLAHAPEHAQFTGTTKHACAALTNLSQITELGLSLTAECVESLPELNDEGELLKRAPAIIVAKRGLERLNELLGGKADEFWRGQTATTLTPMAALTEAWCARLDAALWAKLPTDSLTAINGNCYAALKLPNKHTQLQLFAPDALTKVDNEQAKSIDFSQLRDDQLDQLSAQIPEDGKHAAPVLIKDLHALSPARCAHLSARTWWVLPPALLKGLTAAQVKEIPAERMSLWTAAHLRAVPFPALSALQAPQVRELGSGLKDEQAQKAITEALVAVGGKVDDADARRAIQTRAAQAKLNGASQLTYSLTATLAAAMLAMIVF